VLQSDTRDTLAVHSDDSCSKQQPVAFGTRHIKGPLASGLHWANLNAQTALPGAILGAIQMFPALGTPIWLGYVAMNWVVQGNDLEFCGAFVALGFGMEHVVWQCKVEVATHAFCGTSHNLHGVAGPLLPLWTMGACSPFVRIRPSATFFAANIGTRCCVASAGMLLGSVQLVG